MFAHIWSKLVLQAQHGPETSMPVFPVLVSWCTVFLLWVCRGESTAGPNSCSSCTQLLANARSAALGLQPPNSMRAVHKSPSEICAAKPSPPWWIRCPWGCFQCMLWPNLDVFSEKSSKILMLQATYASVSKEKEEIHCRAFAWILT